MTKIAILKRKLIRAYNNPKNLAFSRFKGYPEETYFGYASLEDMIKSKVHDFREFYGPTLKKWRYIG